MLPELLSVFSSGCDDFTLDEDIEGVYKGDRVRVDGGEKVSNEVHSQVRRARCDPSQPGVDLSVAIVDGTDVCAQGSVLC